MPAKGSDAFNSLSLSSVKIQWAMTVKSIEKVSRESSPESLKKLTDIVWPAIKKNAQQEIESVEHSNPNRSSCLKRLYLKLVGRILSINLEHTSRP